MRRLTSFFLLNVLTTYRYGHPSQHCQSPPECGGKSLRADRNRSNGLSSVLHWIKSSIASSLRTVRPCSVNPDLISITFLVSKAPLIYTELKVKSFFISIKTVSQEPVLSSSSRKLIIFRLVACLPRKSIKHNESSISTKSNLRIRKRDSLRDLTKFDVRACSPW